VSHYSKIQTQFRDLATLVEQLKARYSEVEVHEKAQTLYDWHGNSRPEQAEVIVRRVNIGFASNDLGFHKTTDGTYEAIISDYDRHNYCTEKWLGELTQDYAESVIAKRMLSKRFSLVSKKLEDGKRKLVYRRMS